MIAMSAVYLSHHREVLWFISTFRTGIEASCNGSTNLPMKQVESDMYLSGSRRVRDIDVYRTNQHGFPQILFIVY